MPPQELSQGVQSIFPDEAKEFFDTHKEGTYTLLDVRMPTEYEDAHLPGARLVPLPELMDALGSIDREQPLIVYCAVGGRSFAAAQFLLHHGFKDVRHLMGGLDAWEEATTATPVGFHLQFVSGAESPREAIGIAYRMEEGMRLFHETVRARTTDAEVADVLGRLVKAEEAHKSTVLGLLPEADDREALVREAALTSGRTLMEGGLDVEAFLEANKAYLSSISGYLELAMMIETQALDLYLRMAGTSANPDTRGVLYRIGDEEKSHLAQLGRLMEMKGRPYSEAEEFV